MHIQAGLCKLLKVLVGHLQMEKYLGFTRSLHSDLSWVFFWGSAGMFSGSPAAPDLLLFGVIY